MKTICFIAYICSMGQRIDIIGDIEGYWGVGFDKIQSQLDRVEGDEVEVRLHSPGGSVLEGFAIRNALLNHKGNVTIKVIGFAASIASLILTGANDVVVQKGSFVMIHNVSLWSREPMTAEQMKAEGKTLAFFENEIIEAYVDAAEKRGKLIDKDRKKTKAKFQKLVDAETWLNAQQAVDLGLADRIEEQQSQSVSNRFSNTLSNYKNIPTAIKNSYMSKEENKEETISLGAFERMTKAVANLLGLNKATNESTLPVLEEEPNQEPNQEEQIMTTEEMIASLSKDGYEVTKPVTPTEEPTQEEGTEELKAALAKIENLTNEFKTFKASMAGPSGERITGESKKVDPIDAIIAKNIK